MSEPLETGHEGEDFRSLIVYLIAGKPVVVDSADGLPDGDMVQGLQEMVVKSNGCIFFFRLFANGEFFLSQQMTRKGVDYSIELEIAEHAVTEHLAKEGFVREEIKR